MLKCTNLHASLNKKLILRGINLEIKPNEIHVILGPNGSGKSTLGNVILGHPSFDVKGDIEILGENVNKLDSAERAKKGYFLSFQSPPEIDGVSVKDLLFAAKKSLDPTFSSSFKFKKELEQTLESVHLSKEFAEREIHKGFSGGERKKIEMASCLILDPKIAFLDEIDSGVDVMAVSALAKGINKFFARGNKSLIIVSHTEKLLRKINPTHVHILCGGIITESGGTEIIDKVHKEGFCKCITLKVNSLNFVSYKLFIE